MLKIGKVRVAVWGRRLTLYVRLSSLFQVTQLKIRLRAIEKTTCGVKGKIIRAPNWENQCKFGKYVG